MWKTMCILIVENYALCESLPRTVAWESAFHLALRNCSKEVKEEPGYRGIFTGRKKNKPSCSQKSKDYCWSQKQTSKDSSVFLCMRRCKSVSSVAQSCPTLWPHGLQHTRLPCPSPTPGACSNSCPSSWWWRPIISSSAISFSSWLQSFPTSGSFQMSQLSTSGGQRIGVSALASVLPMNIQDWFPLGLTGWISLQTKGLSRVFSNTTVQKHQFFGTQLFL